MFTSSSSIESDQSQTTPADLLKRLEEEHKDLEESVRERLQSLKMQLKISDLPFDLVEGRKNS